MKTYVVETFVQTRQAVQADSRGLARQLAIRQAIRDYGVLRDAITAYVLTECNCGYSFDSDNPHHTEECPCAIM